MTSPRTRRERRPRRPSALLALVALLLASVGAAVALPTAASAATTYGILSTTAPSRPNPVPLDGTTVSGDLYAYTSPDTGVKKVDFFIDDTAQTRAPFHSESTGPYDLNGGAPASPAPYSTLGLPDGAHTLTQRVTPTSGAVQVLTATFTVRNATTPPPAPTGVTAVAGNGTVTLGWDAPTGSTVGYNVYRGTSTPVSTSGPALNGAALVSGTGFTDTTAANGTTYSYVVQSVDSAGRHTEAAPVTATPTAPPAAPTYVLSSSASADRSTPAALAGRTVSGALYAFTTPATDVTKVEFFLDDAGTAQAPVSTDTSAPFDLAGGSPSAAAPYDTTKLANGSHTLTQRVTAAAVTTSTATFTVANTATPPVSPPPAPTGLTATGRSGAVDLAWTSGGGSTAGFNVYRGTGSSAVSTTGTPLNGAALVSGTSFTDTTVVNGTTYSYVVSAVDADGRHAESAARTATPTAPASSDPFTLSLSGAPDRSGAVPLAGSTVAGDIYVFTSPDTGIKRVDFYLDDTAMAAAPFHGEATGPYDLGGGSAAASGPVDSRALADGNHAVTQKVTRTNGAVVVFTAAFAVKNTVTPPPVPTHVAATAGDGSVALSWDARTGSTVGFNVFRGTGGSASTGSTPLNGSTLLTGSSFTDSSAVNGTAYSYVVQSVDAFGRHSEAAAVSATPSQPTPGSASVSPDPVVLFATNGVPGVVEPVTLTNRGQQALSVSAVSVGGANASNFVLSGVPAFPVSVPAGGSLQVGVRLSSSTSGVKAGSLTFATSSPVTPSVTATLRGLVLSSPGAEPSLQSVLDTWQIPVSTGGTSGTIYLPSTTPLGDEVNGQVLVKAASGPVTVTPLGAFTGSALDPTLRLGWVPEGTPAPVAPLFTVAGPENRTVQVHPAGATSFDPGDAAFGLSAFFAGSARQVFQERRLNGFTPSLPTQARVYPFRTAAGVTVPDAFVVAFEDSTSGNLEYNDAVLLVRNVHLEQLVQSTTDTAPSSTRLALSRFGQNLNGTPGASMHNVGTVRFTNTTGADLAVTGATTTGPFTLYSAAGTPTFPLTVPAGGSADVQVRFTAVRAPVLQSGTLTVTTNDPDRPTRTITLAGVWAPASGGDNEPNLPAIVGAFGYTTALTTGNQALNTRGSKVPVGDEVLSAFWQRSDPTLPITATQLASYQGAAASGLFWYPASTTPTCSSSGCTRVVLNQGTDYQTVLPRGSGVTTNAVGSWSTAAPFGLNVNRVEYTDDSRNSTTNDVGIWKCASACGHHIRMYPVKNSAGQVVPGSYLLAEDSNGINFDYQDNIYLITNIKPAP